MAENEIIIDNMLITEGQDAEVQEVLQEAKLENLETTPVATVEENQGAEVQEVVQEVEVEDVETFTVEVSETFITMDAPNDALNHALLNNRELPDQHPITSITGLRTELDQIEALQTVYSDQKQQADYYMWLQDDTHALPANPYGLFVSIYPDTDKIQICDGSNDVFGVTVAHAAFIGNQAYAKAEGAAQTGRDGAYCLVSNYGVVGVRRETTVAVGDYVVPNIRGEAKKSDGNYGYLVTALSEVDGVPYAMISLSAPSTLAKRTAESVQDLSSRMSTAEYNIASVANVANSAYALAKDAKENAEVNSEYIEEKITEVIGRMDKIDSEDGIVDILNQSINNACADAALAKTIAQNAVSEARQIGYDAYASANEAIAAIKDIGAGSTSWAKRIDAYSVGEYSQAYGLSLEQAKSALEVGIVHIPTITHTETYVSESTYEQEFSIGYYYEWNGEKWTPSLSTAVNFSSVYIAGSEQAPYWVVTDADVEYNGAIYKLGYLYKWENGTWSMTGASIAENTLTRAVSAIHQTANELSMEVTNARGDAASLSVRLEEDEAVVQSLVSWTGSEEGKYNLATTKMSADDDGASIALVVVKDGTDEEIGGARIVLNDSDNGSYIQLDADKINFLSQEFNIYPSDGKGNIASTEPNFSVDAEGNVGIKGKVSAYTGDIGGWNIGETSLCSDDETVGMSSDDKDENGEFDANKVAFWAGKSGDGTPPFSVTHGGSFTATSGKIGGWQIGDSGLAAGNVGLYSGEDKKYYAQNSAVRLYAGDPSHEVAYGYLISSVTEIQVKYFEAYDTQKLYIENGTNKITSDTIVEFAFLEDGTPVLYTTDLSRFPDVDYADRLIYVGQSELNGEVCDHWVRYINGVAEDGVYTNIIVETDTSFDSNFYVLDNGTMVAKEAQIEGVITSGNYHHSKKMVSWANDEAFIDIPNVYTTAVRDDIANANTLGIKYKIESNNTATIVGANLDATMENVYIASSYEGCSVVKIADGAFANNTIIKSIVLPDSLESIGTNAFIGCTSLISFYLPYDVTFGDSVFYGCDKLKYAFINSIWSLGEGLWSEDITISPPADQILSGDSTGIDVDVGYKQYSSSISVTREVALSPLRSSCFINDVKLTENDQVIAEYSMSVPINNPTQTTSYKLYAKITGDTIQCRYHVNKISTTAFSDAKITWPTVMTVNATVYYAAQNTLYYSENEPPANMAEDYWHYISDDFAGFKISSNINENMLDSRYFTITSDGSIHATSGNIGGLTLSDNKLQSGNFILQTVNNDGNLATEIKFFKKSESGEKLEATRILETQISSEDIFADNIYVDNIYIQDGLAIEKRTIAGTKTSIELDAGTGDTINCRATLTFRSDGMNCYVRVSIRNVNTGENQNVEVPHTFAVKYKNWAGSDFLYDSVSVPAGQSTAEKFVGTYLFGIDEAYFAYGVQTTQLDFTQNKPSDVIKVTGNLIPSENDHYTLGSATTGRWQYIHYMGGSLGSDRKIKNNISDVDMDFCKQLITGLQPKSYEWKTANTPRTHYGFIAQEVEELLHSLGTSADEVGLVLKSIPGAPDSEDNKYSLNYMDLMAPMVSVIQQLLKRVETLEHELRTIQNDCSASDEAD